MSLGRNIALAVVALAASFAAGCSTPSHSSVPVAANAGPTEVVLAIGGSATEGDGVRNRLQDAWPYLIFHDDLPLSTVFVNGALDDATVAHALTTQAPLGAELKPEIVEVWLGADDLRADTPIPAFAADLTRVVKVLRTGGAHRILIADLPRAYGAGAVKYNAAIHAVVTGTHAELVPLADVAITLARTDGLPPQPDTASDRAIAAAFEKVIANPTR